jgi:hypothetical protein
VRRHLAAAAEAHFFPARSSLATVREEVIPGTMVVVFAMLSG